MTNPNIELAVHTPMIEVTAYKKSGKFYTSLKQQLKPEHAELSFYKFLDMCRDNDQQVQDYSGIRGGFINFYFVVRVDNPTEQMIFCNFSLDRTDT